MGAQKAGSHLSKGAEGVARQREQEEAARKKRTDRQSKAAAQMEKEQRITRRVHAGEDRDTMQAEEFSEET